MDDVIKINVTDLKLIILCFISSKKRKERKRKKIWRG